MAMKEDLETAGCKILNEDESKLLVSCPIEVFDRGLKVEGAKTIVTKRGEKEITLVIEKSERE